MRTKKEEKQNFRVRFLHSRKWLVLLMSVQSIIGGSQAFVMSPKGPHDYVTALRRKQVTEVSMNIDTHVPPMDAPALSAPIADPR
ncbi:hypothetical protein [Mesorhizobium sp.]|uniref:hypothetical protein n=1 Tax=Mesorhizobium sp. TaxID=1871066 RepID=UPI0034523E20